MERITHRYLSCGVELGVVQMPNKQVEAIEFRLLAGAADDPAEKLGLTRLINETIDKGTARRDGRALFDALDEIGASTDEWIGREASGYTCLCLPDLVERAVELHAEFLCLPTFPEDAVQTAIALADQELTALEDDPPSLAEKLIERQAFGDILGRHPLGERETLASIRRDDLLDHWRRLYSAGGMQVTAAGPLDASALADLIERFFADFGSASLAGRQVRPHRFEPARHHHPLEAEQEQIAIAFPSAAVTDADFPAERVLLGVLAGGMSARLFTEVREKQGLAYDVHARNENPRGRGMIFVSASCKPDRAEATFQTLLREIDRLREDVTQEEVDRAITRLVAREETMADMTRSRRAALAYDLFHHRRPVPIEERIARLRAVTVKDVVEYLSSHPHDRLSILTLGPTGLHTA